jgi:hypothetical protein
LFEKQKGVDQMNMMRMGVMLALAGLLTVPVLQAKDEAGKGDVDKDVARLLKSAGAVTVARKSPYGAGIDSVHIGFGADEKPVVGIALRKTKTYAEAIAIVSVTPGDGGYVIKAAEIPDIGTFHGKSQEYAQNALKDIAGRSFADSKSARGLVDAVSGATQYYKAIYVSYALMASKVIDELSTPPDWKREAL